MNLITIKLVPTVEINGKTFKNPKSAAKELAIALTQKHHPRECPSAMQENDEWKALMQENDEWKAFRAEKGRFMKRTVARVLPILTNILNKREYK
jgi:hypothetical protein|tara:strand:+ start:24 stop:308 length:285 start_codon:yes stop_codon:yes gene_type:complete